MRFWCWIGLHKWIYRGPEVWRCRRCHIRSPKCDNCGDWHNPNAIVVCTVTRSW